MKIFLVKSREILQDLRNSSLLIAIIYLLDAINDVSKNQTAELCIKLEKKSSRSVLGQM